MIGGNQQGPFHFTNGGVADTQIPAIDQEGKPGGYFKEPV
jgi:hypothetical protein